VAGILILGGGFAGVYTARMLEKLGARDVTLVNRENYFIFEPMLPEVAAAELDPRDILTPIRAMCPRTRFVQGEVQAIDLDARRVSVDGRELAYDQLVLALGSTTIVDLPGVREHAIALKTIGDALYLRNHVIRTLERCDTERRPITVVVAGGGFSGVEVAAELNDFIREARRFYPCVEPRFVLVHAGDRLLPELPEKLGAYAERHLRRRGVDVRLKTPLTGAEAGAVLLGGERVACDCFVSTIGNAPVPIVRDLPVPKDERGRIKVEPHLEVVGRKGVWAVGDCASILNPETGRPYPPSAQFAVREAAALARNLVREPRPFAYKGLGMFVSLGRRTAVGDMFGLRVTGFLAWWLWRSIYLMKLPGLDRKLRVAANWTVHLFFPPDIVEVSYTRS